MRIVTLLLLSSFVVASSGCVSKGRHQREMNSLQSQVAEMDAALKAQQERSQTLAAELETLRAEKAKQAEEAARQQVSPEFTGGMYRTPSGFELPATDIQKALKSAGYYVGPVDGKIGPDSREALRNFQRDNGLTVDGVCGRETWAKLKTYLDVLK